MCDHKAALKICCLHCSVQPGKLNFKILHSSVIAYAGMDTSYRFNFLKAVPSYVRRACVSVLQCRAMCLLRRLVVRSHVLETFKNVNWQNIGILYSSAIIVKYEPTYCACDLIAVVVVKQQIMNLCSTQSVIAAVLLRWSQLCFLDIAAGARSLMMTTLQVFPACHHASSPSSWPCSSA